MRRKQGNNPRPHGSRGILAIVYGLLGVFVLAINAWNLSLDLFVSHGASLGLDGFTKRSSANKSKARQYLSFDDAAPKAIPGMERSHSLPNAVPQRRVIPREFAEDETYQIAQRTNTSTKSILGEKGRRRPFYHDTKESGTFNWNHSYSKDNRPLYLYNPSVLPLVSGDADSLSDDDLVELTGGDPAVAYVATYRANIGGNCFGPDHPKLMKAGEQVSYLALALLDERLDAISGTDVLIDINAGPSYGKYFQQFQEDCKLTIMRGSTFLLCNERIFHISVRRTKASDNERTTHSSGTRHTGKDLKYPYVYPNIYGDGLEITVFSQTKIAGGKNFNFFRHVARPNDQANPYDYYLQVYPLPHKYLLLNIPPAEHDKKNQAVITPGPEQQSTAVLPRPSFDGPDTANTIVTCPENEVPGSHTWITNCTEPNEKPFFGDNDHGTACCVSLSLGEESGKNVLVGVSHTKTSLVLNPWWRRDIFGRYNNRIGGKRYLSRFVAYNPDPPFDIVARSGWFCLGFGSNEDKGNNTLVGRNTHYRLDLFRRGDGGGKDKGNDTYKCPMIHFVSGITEFVGNASRVVLSYGVSDCYPRMIVVEKEEIARRLLGL